MVHPSQMKTNFLLPINLARLQDHRLRLVPIESCTEENLQEYIDETCLKNPELWKFFPVGPHESVEAYKEWYNQFIRENPAAIIFAMYLRAGSITRQNPVSGETETFEFGDDTFAGTTGLINASIQNSVVELGHVMVLPKFHRTWVNTVASSLLLKHLLDPVDQGDLQMRRVQWQADSLNRPSIMAAQRLGFICEGIIRWQRIVADHKVCASTAHGTRSEDKPTVDAQGRNLGPGRHSAILAMCWDDWLDGKRDHVLGLLARV